MATNYPFEKRVHIRCLFISRMRNTSNIFDYGLLTDDFTFYLSHILTTNHTDLTSNMYEKLRFMFSRFFFDKNTEIDITSNMSKYHPLALYLRSLLDHIGFRLRFVNQIKVVKRITTYHTRYMKKSPKKVCFSDYKTLWTKILEDGRCPWITVEVEKSLLESSDAFAHRTRFLRLGVYYILVKQHFMAIANKSIASTLKRKAQKNTEELKLKENLKLLNVFMNKIGITKEIKTL